MPRYRTLDILPQKFEAGVRIPVARYLSSAVISAFGGNRGENNRALFPAECNPALSLRIPAAVSSIRRTSLAVARCSDNCVRPQWPTDRIALDTQDARTLHTLATAHGPPSQKMSYVHVRTFFFTTEQSIGYKDKRAIVLYLFRVLPSDLPHRGYPLRRANMLPTTTHHPSSYGQRARSPSSLVWTWPPRPARAPHTTTGPARHPGKIGLQIASGSQNPAGLVVGGASPRHVHDWLPPTLPTPLPLLPLLLLLLLLPKWTPPLLKVSCAWW